MPALLPHAGPDLGRELNRQHPLSRRCMIATHFAGRSTGDFSAMGAQDSFNSGDIRGATDPPVISEGDGTLSFDTGRGGRALFNAVEGSAEVNYGDSRLFLPTAAGSSFVALCYMEKTDAVERTLALFGPVSGGSSNRCGVFTLSGSLTFNFGGTGGSNTLVWSEAPWVVNEPNVFVFYKGPRGMEIWMDGIIRVSNTNQPSRSQVSNDFSIGTVTTVTMDRNRWYAFLCWDRDLKEAEIQEISRDPFLLWRPPLHRVYFVPAAAAARNRAMVVS